MSSSPGLPGVDGPAIQNQCFFTLISPQIQNFTGTGMATETEIKLRVSPQDMDRLAAHPLLERYRSQPWQSRELLNAYFDTEAGDLARAQVALRIRRDGEQFIQTLKSKGASMAGLSERHEWDWYIDSDRLDMDLLGDECWPYSLHQLDKQQLTELFRTDFTRKSTELAWEHRGVPTRVEVALDSGKVATACGDEPICELELELREGQPAALLELALQLAADIALMPCDISKAERGYRLLQPGSFELNVCPAQLVAGQDIDSAFAALMQEQLAASQRLAEQYRHTSQWKLLQGWFDQLTGMRALLGSMGQLVPRKSSHGLRLVLDALLADWQPVIRAGMAGREQRDAAVALFAAELQQARWGMFSLELALWLHDSGWQTGRNERLERQAKAPLERWLVRFLQEQAQELGLEAYKLKAYALNEQQPRLERIMVWLEAARHVLTATELDDTLGALRKLHDSLQADDPDARSRALLQTCADPGWKALLRGSY